MRGESLRKDRKASNGESERYTRARAQVMRNRMEVVPANEMCFDFERSNALRGRLLLRKVVLLDLRDGRLEVSECGSCGGAARADGGSHRVVTHLPPFVPVVHLLALHTRWRRGENAVEVRTKSEAKDARGVARVRTFQTPPSARPTQRP